MSLDRNAPAFCGVEITMTSRDHTAPSAGSFIIRAAGPRDVDAIAVLLTTSAEAQGSRDSLCVNAEGLLREGFNDRPRFHVLVAASNTGIVGFALYFFTYSTWTSVNGLYLEDLYVDLGWRRHGIARALMRELASIAVNAGCRRFQWLVLRSNEPALRFYESLGAEGAHDWLLMQLGGDGLDRLVRGQTLSVA
jgi:GNAT superfamily N-acetyltransferase